MGFLQGFTPGFLDDFDFTGGPVQDPYQPPAPPVNSGGPIFDFIGEPVGLPPGFGGPVGLPPGFYEPVLPPGVSIDGGVGDITQGGISGNGPDGATGGSGGVGGAPTGGGNVIYNPGPGVSGVYGDPGIGTGGFAPVIGVPFGGGNDLVTLPDDWEDRLFEIINGGGIGGIFDSIGGGPGQVPVFGGPVQPPYQPPVGSGGSGEGGAGGPEQPIQNPEIDLQNPIGEQPVIDEGGGEGGPVYSPGGSQGGGGEGGAGGPDFSMPPGSIFNQTPGQGPIQGPIQYPNPQPNPQTEPDPEPEPGSGTDLENPIGEQPVIDEGDDSVDQDLLDRILQIIGGGNGEGEGVFAEGGTAANIMDIITDIFNETNVDTDIDNTVDTDIDNTVDTDVDNTVNTDIDNTSQGGAGGSSNSNSQGGAGGTGGAVTSTTDVNNDIDNTSAGGEGGAGGAGGVGQGGTSNSTSEGGNAEGGAGGNAQGGNAQGGVGQGGVGQGGSSSSQGGTGGDSSNTLTELLSNVGNTVLNTGVSNYVSDQQSKANKDAIAYSQGIYDSQVDRLEPFRQVGIDAIPGATDALNNKPEVLDLFDGQQTINPNTDVQGPTAGQVDVNKIDVFDRNSDALRFLQDEQMQAVNNGFASSGKLNSGGRYKALQDRAANVASTYAGQMQGINTAQDRANLLSDSQRFGQDATSSGFDLNQAQGNIANNFGLNSQLFNNNMAANNFYQNANSQDFNQFLNMLQLGGNAAAGQGQGMTKTQGIGATLTEDLGNIKTSEANSYLKGIKGLFS